MTAVLAQRLAKHPRWEWRGGMLLHQPGCSGAYRSRIRVLDVTPDKVWCSHPELEHRFFFGPSSKGHGLYTCSLDYPMARALNNGAWAAALPLAPDLSDDATAGVLLGMVREWAAVDGGNVMTQWSQDDEAEGGDGCRVDARRFDPDCTTVTTYGDTLGEAAAACLLACWALDNEAGR